jgi:hypothetical protein
MKVTFENEESLLQKTSILLTIPSFYGLYYKNYQMAIPGLIGSGVSYLFWVHPTFGLRRNIDLLYQPILSTYFLIQGNLNSKNKKNSIIGDIFFTSAMILFKKSHQTYQAKDRFWYIYHSLFHVAMMGSSYFAYKTQIN